MADSGYLEQLRSVPLFSSCSGKQLEEVGRIVDELRLPMGRTLVRQGEVGFEMLIILEGTADVVRDGMFVSSVGPGSAIGEMAVLTTCPRNATVTATTDMTLLSITRSGLDQLLDDMPGFAKHLLFEVAGRVAAS